MVQSDTLFAKKIGDGLGEIKDLSVSGPGIVKTRAKFSGSITINLRVLYYDGYFCLSFFASYVKKQQKVANVTSETSIPSNYFLLFGSAFVFSNNCFWDN